MKFTGNWSGTYEGWPAGAPEIDVRVFSPSTASNFKDLGEIRFIDNMEPGRKADIDHRWWANTISIVPWDKSIYTETLMFDFTEDDYQPAPQFEEITIGGKFKVFGQDIDLSVKFSIKTVDEHIGKMTVNQCAAPPRNDDGEYYDVNQYFRFKVANL